MRARFSAFATRQLPFLMRTLHSSHPDAHEDPDTLRLSLRKAVSTVKYVRLHVLDSEAPDEHGTARVLFFADLYENGKPRGFVELSDFQREGGEWKYLSGEALGRSELGADPLSLDIRLFRERLRKA